MSGGVNAAPSPREHCALTWSALGFPVLRDKQAQMWISRCYLVCHQTYFLKPQKRD